MKTTNTEAEWIEQQPLRIQEQALIAQAHDDLRQLASDTEVCLLAERAGDDSAATLCGQDMYEISTMSIVGDLRSSLSQLANT